MQFRLIPALIVFFGSYFPLALILLVQDIRKEYWGRPVCTSFGVNHCDYALLANPATAISVVLLSAAAVGLVVMLLRKVRLRFSAQILESKPVPNELISYVFPYVVSFMGLSYSNSSALAGFFVFFCLMFAITYKSGLIVMNPLLILFGWRLYDIRLKLGDEERLIRAFSRQKLTCGSCRYEVVQDVYFVGGA